MRTNTPVLMLLGTAMFVFIALVSSNFGNTETWRSLSITEAVCLLAGIAIACNYYAFAGGQDKVSMWIRLAIAIGLFFAIFVKNLDNATNPAINMELPFLREKFLVYVILLNILPLGMISTLEKSIKSWKYFELTYALSIACWVYLILVKSNIIQLPEKELSFGFAISTAYLIWATVKIYADIVKTLDLELKKIHTHAVKNRS